MNKRMIVIIAILGIIVLLTGCAPAPTAPPIPQPPATCTIIVTSEAANVWGQTVYLDGQAVPNSILAPWGSVQIDNVSVGVRHAIYIMQGGALSHTEYIVTQPGINYVSFYWF